MCSSVYRPCVSTGYKGIKVPRVLIHNVLLCTCLITRPTYFDNPYYTFIRDPVFPFFTTLTNMRFDDSSNLLSSKIWLIKEIVSDLLSILFSW